MLIGIPPFFTKNQMTTYQLILKAPIKWPIKERHGFAASPQAMDLIEKLLCKDKTKRLGSNGDS